MENANQETDPEKGQTQINPQEQQEPTLDKIKENQSQSQAPLLNQEINPPELNNPNNGELNSQPKLDEANENNINNGHQEENPQEIKEQSQDINNNISQINNMNQINYQEMQINQQQINEQYMLQYQNQMNQMNNNPQEIPMNNYILNYNQIQGQLSPEQMQYQQQMESNENKNIYDYMTNMKLFGISFQNGNCPRLAISSLEKRLDNKIEILELIDNKDLKKVYEQHVGYPCTKVLWSPNKNKNSLLAFSSDSVQIYDYSEEKQVLSYQTRLNNKKSKYSGPLTSFDWNIVNDSILGTASIDNTCTIWDLNKQTIKTQLIAHEKEVFDIQFGPDENIFISGGADGTVRLFDLRALDHSTIIYETKGCINKVAWNLKIPNLIVATG